MNWLISIHFYLWQNSLRRWWEQPLSLLSKLVVSALLTIFGAIVILGIKELGEELDRRLQDREALLVIISESIRKDRALDILNSEEIYGGAWRGLGKELSTFLIAQASARLGEREAYSVVALANPELHGLVDDFYLLSPHLKEGEKVNFSILDYQSEATTKRIAADFELISSGRNLLVGDMQRLYGLLTNGFSMTQILRAESVDEVERAHDIVAALNTAEDRDVMIQSNLWILSELRKVREIQAQSLWWVSIGSSLILGLILGSLAWMEFREERYLLSLIRSFGVGRMSLFTHTLLENILLALAGVILGLSLLQVMAMRLDLGALGMSWLNIQNFSYAEEGKILLIGAAFGGLLASLPVAIGLRKSLGLVLK